MTPRHSEAFSFQIATDDQAETDRYWNAIVGNGGQESACGWCKDRWGLSWQITPRALTDALAAGGAEAKRAFEAMTADEEDRRRHHRGGATRLTTSWAGTAGPESLRALRDDDVRGLVAGGLLGADIAERRQIEACQQVFSRAEQHRGNGQVHLVDESRLQKLSNGRGD